MSTLTSSRPVLRTGRLREVSPVNTWTFIVFFSSLRLRFLRWCGSESELFTRLVGEDGETFTHGDVLKAHGALLLVLLLIGIGGSL